MQSQTNNSNEETHPKSNLKLLGRIAFDKNGDKVLINKSGKVFATDELIQDVWRELEKLDSLKEYEFYGIEDLRKRVRSHGPHTDKVKIILHKFNENNLIEI